MYNQLKNEILKNNGGTYNGELKNANLKNGFVVSITGYEYITNDINDAIKKMIEYKSIIKTGYYVGVWVDTQDNNTIYVDISKHVKSKQKAEETARANKQKAYFDIRKLESVYLNYEVVYYSLYKNVMDATGKLLNQIFIKGYDAINEIPSNYRNDKKNYFILKDYINIQEL